LFFCFNDGLKDNIDTHYQLKRLGNDELFVVGKSLTVTPPSDEEKN
jgi:hypothetical protein